MTPLYELRNPLTRQLANYYVCFSVKRNKTMGRFHALYTLIVSLCLNNVLQIVLTVCTVKAAERVYE